MEFHPISHRIPEPYHHEEWWKINQCNRWQKPILFLSILFLKTDLLLHVGILDDLVQSWSDLRVQHFENSGNYCQQLIAKISIRPLNRPSPLLWSIILRSEGKSEQGVTWLLNLIFQYKNEAGVGNLSNWSSDICCLFCPTIKLCGISTRTKEFIVVGLLANVGIGIVFPIRSSSLATSLTCSTWCRKLINSSIGVCDDSSVERGFAKTFSCDPDRFHVSSGKRLSQPSIARGLGILAGWVETCEHGPLWFDSTSWHSPESFK